MNDRIILTGLEFYGYHGVEEAENQLGQPFILDLELYLDLRKAGRRDSLGDTVDYAAVYQSVATVFHGHCYKLLEALAENIAASVLSQFQVAKVCVRVTKPYAPIAGNIKALAVEIVRESGDM